ncbi:hypothetical protein JCM17380_24400 [Desulfosporosinus burensis]
MANFITALLVITIGIAEFLGIAWILKFALTSFVAGNITMLSTGSLLLVLLWLGWKDSNTKKVQ